MSMVGLTSRWFQLVPWELSTSRPAADARPGAEARRAGSHSRSLHPRQSLDRSVLSVGSQVRFSVGFTQVRDFHVWSSRAVLDLSYSERTLVMCFDGAQHFSTGPATFVCENPSSDNYTAWNMSSNFFDSRIRREDFSPCKLDGDSNVMSRTLTCREFLWQWHSVIVGRGHTMSIALGLLAWWGRARADRLQCLDFCLPSLINMWYTSCQRRACIACVTRTSPANPFLLWPPRERALWQEISQRGITGSPSELKLGVCGIAQAEKNVCSLLYFFIWNKTVYKYVWHKILHY